MDAFYAHCKSIVKKISLTVPKTYETLPAMNTHSTGVRMETKHTPGPRYAQIVKAGRGFLIVRNSATLADTDYEHVAKEICAALNDDQESGNVRRSQSPAVALLKSDLAKVRQDRADLTAERDALRAENALLLGLLIDVVNGIDYERGAGDGVDHESLLIRTRAALAKVSP